MLNPLQQGYYTIEICFFLKSCEIYTIPGNNLISFLDAEERLHKTRTRFLTSCFKCGSMPHQNEACTVPTIKKGKLFGQELSSICVEEKWPTVTLVGLSWLISGFPKESLIKKISVA